MLKKIFCVLIAVLLFLPVNIYGSEKGITLLNEEEAIGNVSQSYFIDYHGEEGRVFYGDHGIDILTEDHHYHLTTTFAVEKLSISNDINGDGYPEFVTYQVSNNDQTDQLYVISGDDGEVLSSYRFSYTTFSDSLGYTQTNSVMQSIRCLNDGTAMIICDYSLIRMDLESCTPIWEYEHSNNIWKEISISDINGDGYGDIAATTQTGELVVFDCQNGDKLYSEKITEDWEIHVTDDGEKEKIYTTEKNLWDLYWDDSFLWVTSEDGQIYKFDGSDLSNYEAYDAGVLEADALTSMLNYGWNSDYTEIVYNPTGINDNSYMGYQIADDNDQYLLLSAYLGNLDRSYSDAYYPATIELIEKNTGDIKAIISLDENSLLCQNPILTQYKDQDVIMLISEASSENIKLGIYDLTGKQIYQKNIETKIVPSDSKVKLTETDQGYLLESMNNGAMLISLDLEKVTYLYDTSSAVLADEREDGIVVEMKVNNIATKLVSYDYSLNKVWEYEVSQSYANTGISSIQKLDFNKDNIEDYLLLVNQKDDAVEATHFIVVDGNNGQQLMDSTLKTGEYVENKVKKSTYLQTSNVKVLSDMNNDGIKEILVNDSDIYRLNNLKQIGTAYGGVEANGTQLEIGDGNGDGFSEIVVVSDKTAQLYTSKITYSYGEYELSYVKTNHTRTNVEALKNSQYATTISDINNDGACELIFMDQNESGYQIFKVVDGMTLTDLYSFCQYGVTDWGESFTVLDIDLNHDGYQEIYGYEYDCSFIIDGKTGDFLIVNATGDGDTYLFDDPDYIDDYIYHPDYIVSFYEGDQNENIFTFADYDKDGYKDLAVRQSYYYWDDIVGSGEINSIIIYGSSNNEAVGSIDLSGLDTISNCVAIPNSDKYIILNGNKACYLFDIDTFSVCATYSLNPIQAYALDEDHILAITSSGLYKLNIECNFELLSDIPETTGQNELMIEWSELTEGSLMTIYDNKTLIYQGTDTQYSFKLLEGEHTITLDMSDGQGKSSRKSYKVTITQQKSQTMWVVVLAGGMIAVCLFISIYHKLKMHQQAKVVK